MCNVQWYPTIGYPPNINRPNDAPRVTNSANPFPSVIINSMNLNYKCLVLDHDDTTVNSTPCIHYPAFIDAVRQLRPGAKYADCSLEEVIEIAYDPGLFSFYTKTLGFSPAEMAAETAIWRDRCASVTAPFFPGMREIIQKQRELGGTVAVVSASCVEFIERDYRAAGIPVPELLFGWNCDHEKNKPSPWPLQEIMRLTGYGPEDLLMVDDMDLGLRMARGAGVRFAGAGWGYLVPAVHNALRANADFFFTEIPALAALLFGEA